MKAMSMKLYLLFFVWVTTGYLHAQKGYTWKTIPRGPTPNSSGILMKKVIGNDLYYIQRIANLYTVVKWNGIVYTRFTTFILNSNIQEFTTIDVFNGMIILGMGVHANLTIDGNSVPENCYGLHFDGNTWQTTLTMTFSPLSSIVYKKKLFYISTDQRMYSSSDALSFVAIMEFHNGAQGFGAYSGMHICNNQLVIYGSSFDSLLNLSKTSGIAFYNGSTFKRYTYPNMKSNRVFPISDTRFVSYSEFNGSEAVLLWENNAVIEDITNNLTAVGATSSFAFKDSLLFRQIYPQGTIDYYSFTKKTWTLSSQLSRYAPKPLIFNVGNKVYLADTPYVAGVYDILEITSGAAVSGKLFWDKDVNCNFNSGDRQISDVMVKIKGAGNAEYFAVTDNAGNYNLALPRGQYTLQVLLPYTYTISPCSADTIIVDTGAFITHDISVLNTPGIRDDMCKITAAKGYKARQGFTESYRVYYQNLGTVNDSISLVVIYPDNVTFVASSVTPALMYGNQLRYEIKKLNWLDKGYVDLKFTIPVTAGIGDSLYFYSSIVNLENESNASDNSDHLFQKVVGAFDPNSKDCYPSGRIKPGLKKIKYFIHFQNLGTDTAYRVTVIDTVNNKLPLTSVRVTGTSHYSHYSFRVENNTLIWVFENIKLPPKNQDEAGSQGWITFEMDVTPNIDEGDSITNKAYIYFDYQKSVITNTAMVIFSSFGTGIQQPLVIDRTLKLYPNPNTGIFKLVYTGEKPANTAFLYDISGRQVEIFYLVKDEIKDIDLKGLSKGVYIMKDLHSGTVTRFLVE